MNSREKAFFELLKSGKEDGVIKVYDTFRAEFIQWCMKDFSTREADAADLFQDSVIALYYNIRNERIQELTSSLKTYLFAIGRNLALKKLKKESRMIVNDEILALSKAIVVDDSLEDNDKKRVIADLMNELGEPCQSILKLFYFHNFSMDAIASRLGYKNEHVAKSQKLRCFNTLKKLTLSHFNAEDI